MRSVQGETQHLSNRWRSHNDLCGGTGRLTVERPLEPAPVALAQMPLPTARGMDHLARV